MRYNATKLIFHGMAATALLAVAACGENASDNSTAEDSRAGAAMQTPASESAQTETAAQATDSAASSAGATEQSSDDGAFYGDYVVGAEDAPITLVEYASFTCSHCANFHRLVYPKLVENYIEPGKVKFVFRHFVRDGADVAASVVARCRGEERFGAMKDLFFDRQSQWLSGVKTIQDAMDNLAAVARRAGVSRAQFDRCVANENIQNHVIEMTRAGADQFDINATPTLIMNGEILPPVVNENFDELDRILSEELG